MSTWVSWNGGRSHLANVDRRDVRVGGFPLACGRWAPDGFDAAIVVSTYGHRCQRCVKAQDRS